MYLKIHSFSSPEKNILYDEVLFNLAEKSDKGESLRFWESDQYFVVLGKIGKAEDDVDLQQTKKDHIPVLRRCSGGGTVLQGPGCLNFSVVLAKGNDPQLNDITKSYQVILGKVVKALTTLNVQAVFLPICDVALADNQKKISGNAQKRGRHYILHHGTILYAFDLPLISNYLKMPKCMPQYRKARTHQEFISNINVQREDLQKAIAKELGADTPEPLLAEEEQALDKLVQAGTWKV